MKSSAEKIADLIRVSKLYYLDHINQAEISAALQIHRTEISRMLNEARRLGIVKITVDNTYGSVLELSELLQEAFNLETALVVPEEPAASYLDSLTKMGLYADSYLHSIIKSNAKVGVSWGLSLAVAVDSLRHDLFPKGVTVVPLIGGPRGVLPTAYQANAIAYTLASKITGGSPFLLNSPGIVTSTRMRDELLGNPNVSNVTEIWESLNVAIFGIGSSESSGTRSWRQFYKGTLFAGGLGETAVGDILARPFTEDGEILAVPDVHIVGIELEHLRRVPRRVGVALGKVKAKAILGALRSGLVTDLITNSSTAEEMKRLAGL